MESQPQNPEFRIHPENFHPCLNYSFRCEKLVDVPRATLLLRIQKIEF